MFSGRVLRAISKFKADFTEESDDQLAARSLRSDTSSLATTSDDASRHRASLNGSLQNTTTKDDLPPIPDESADDSNDIESISPLQKGSLFESLQNNRSFVSPNKPLSSNESPASHKPSDKLTPISGSLLPVVPVNKRFAVSTLLNRSKGTKNSTSSNDSSVPSTYILPLDVDSNLMTDPMDKDFLSTLLGNQRHESKKLDGTHSNSLDDLQRPEPVKIPELPNFFIPSNTPSSKSTDGIGVYDEQMESIQPSVKQTSQQPRSSPHDQTPLPTAINSNNQRTSDTIVQPDLTPTTQLLSLTSERVVAPNPFLESEVSVPGNFPLNVLSTSYSNPTSNDTDKKVKVRGGKSSTLNSFLISLAVPPATLPAEVPDNVVQTKTQQPTSESSDRLLPNGPYALSPEDDLARRMEQLGRMRRMQSRIQVDQSKGSPEVMSQRSPQPNRTTTTRKTDLWPQLPPLQEDNSSDASTILMKAYIERQQELQTQLDTALAELQDVRAENKRLADENQSQQRSISQLKIAFDEVKHAQDNSSVQIKHQLREAATSLIALNKEKKGWQDMQHQLIVAERQVRCLDHLTRYNLESRQEGAYGQPKRRGLFASVPASTDVIGAMRALNEEIFQTCVQLVEGLERTSPHSNKHKPFTQKALGNHLIAMMEDQATNPIPGYNMLLMQTVLEVFMASWCSSIIEAFYPKQQSFADLLVQLSAQTTRTTGSAAICGKQVQIVQSSTPFTDVVKFNDWVKDIIKELGLCLMLAGLKMKTQRASLFSTKILALVKLAYDLRMAMAEKDICGGLEVVMVPPDIPFQEKWMNDAHGDRRKVGTDPSSHVAGTTGIGLQHKVSERVDGQFEFTMATVLKPKVILVRALNVKD